ncbi:sulfatase [Stieleria sp. TO1_6]|uniref:sulfatase n=1 Tax=Stieleria tagensis TaxID=2956795 RepID=UPI00209B814F|nr:sulfatase [Stieleria tagensis]MCO8125257.1 sulfatase [Stieleria tagensis]
MLKPIVIAALVVLSNVASSQPPAPNIVLFFVDDFGQHDLTCYGSALYETPQMDELAAQGMRFTHAYAAYPRCVPSRQGLLSGKYPSRIENESIRSGNHEHHLPLSEVTFGEALQEHGYRTCYIGKWHLGKDGGGPGDQGFETVIHSGSAGATHSYFYPFPTEKGLTVVNPVDGKPGDYLTDRLTDKAVEYIQENHDAPFLLVMAHYAVHTPLEAPEDTTQKYRKKLRQSGLAVGGKRDDPDLVIDRQGTVKTVQNNPTYAAMVERTDDSLGRIVNAIRTAGIENNTAIILTSDHGGLSTRGVDNHRALATSNMPLRQGKGSIFEGGTRVPLIVKWPGKVRPGTTSEVQVNGTDHYPTLLDIAGATPRPEQHVDGRSYLRALQGESYQREPMFWYKWQARPDSTGDTRALSIIDGRYKLIQWIDEDLVELFDLDEDVGEQVNLADKQPQRVQSMLAALLQTEQQIGNLRSKGKKELERRLQKTKRDR